MDKDGQAQASNGLQQDSQGKKFEPRLIKQPESSIQVQDFSAKNHDSHLKDEL